jgi:hypothetical protein
MWFQTRADPTTTVFASLDYPEGAGDRQNDHETVRVVPAVWCSSSPLADDHVATSVSIVVISRLPPNTAAFSSTDDEDNDMAVVVGILRTAHGVVVVVVVRH